MKIYIKIKSFDPNSKSIIFCCASDKTKHQDPDMYDPMAVQPMTVWPYLKTKDEILKQIAVLAKEYTNAIVLREDQSDNLEMVSVLQNLDGQSFTFNVDDIDMFTQISDGLDTTQDV